MTSQLPHDRRQFLRAAAGLCVCGLLPGCGAGDGVATASIAVVPAGVAPAAAAAAVASGQSPLNLALTLAYVGAQYYGYAARGTGLSAALTGGTGREGAVTGARQASLQDASIAAHAAELADDKQMHVVALRARLGPLAAAQPALDLSTASDGAFSVAAQGAGIVPRGSAFDPYAGDTAFLLGAFLVENTVAAAYRTVLAQAADAATSALLVAQLADVIYHGGLIRSLLDDRAGSDATIDRALTGASALLAGFDGTNVGDQTLGGSAGASANILDAEGRPIPFTRSGAQVLKGLYLSASGVGGFMPAGANGVG